MNPSINSQERRRIVVVQVIAGFSIEKPLGGIERFVVELSTHLDQTRFQPVVFGLWKFEDEYSRKWKQFLNQAGVETIEGPAWDGAHPYQSFFNAYRVFVRALKQKQPDILHSHSQFGDIMAILSHFVILSHIAIMSRWNGFHPRIVRTTHNEQEWRQRKLRRWVLWGLLYPIFFHSEVGLNSKMTRALDGRPVAKWLKKKSRLIPNALNLKRFTEYVPQDHGVETLRSALNIPADGVVVGSIGRLTEQKGYSFFIRAAQRVLQANPKVYFVLVGSGEQESALKRLAQELKIEDRVIFAGSRSNVEDYYSLFDLFVSSSLWEGLPTVIMESMASGRPVVATDIAGTQDLIKDGVNGWLVPAGEVEPLAEKILFALNHPAVGCDYVQRAYAQVEHFSIERVAQRQEELYTHLLSKSSSHES